MKDSAIFVKLSTEPRAERIELHSPEATEIHWCFKYNSSSGRGIRRHQADMVGSFRYRGWLGMGIVRSGFPSLCGLL